jgi:hypothetical protein
LVGWSFSRMVRQTWKPFDFGMSKSHKITSGRFRRASSTPESPSAASKTFQSVRANNLDKARRLSSSSSMINTLGIGGSQGANSTTGVREARTRESHYGITPLCGKPKTREQNRCTSGSVNRRLDLGEDQGLRSLPLDSSRAAKESR